jgi:hypothetical protein
MPILIYSTDGITPYVFGSDDFNGADGSAPDQSKWNETDPYNSFSIQNNKLNYTGANPDHNASIFSKQASLTGDFDIQIDWDITSWSQPPSNTNLIGMLVTDSSGLPVNKWAAITRQFNYQGNQVYVAGSSELGTASIPTTATTGKFRITRSGILIKVYYWSGTQWEWNGNTNGLDIELYTAEELYVDIYIRNYTAAMNVNIDNFVVNSNPGVNQYTDFFTGSNGEAPNTTLWDEVDPNNNLSIYNNKLRYSGTDAPADYRITSKTAFLTGDFIVFVDFDITTINTPSTNINAVHFIFGDNIPTVFTDYVLIGIQKTVAGDLLYVVNDPTGTLSYHTSDMSGKFKLKRTGSTLKGYIWNGTLNQYEWDGNTAGHTFSHTSSAAYKAGIRTRQENTELTVDFDNFIVYDY